MRRHITILLMAMSLSMTTEAKPMPYKSDFADTASLKGLTIFKEQYGMARLVTAPDSSPALALRRCLVVLPQIETGEIRYYKLEGKALSSRKGAKMHIGAAYDTVTEAMMPIQDFEIYEPDTWLDFTVHFNIMTEHPWVKHNPASGIEVDPDFASDILASRHAYIDIPSHDTILLKDLEITPLSTCMAPASPEIKNVTASGAEIEWRATMENPLGYVVSYHPKDNPGDIHTDTTASERITLKKLLPSTTYAAFIETLCNTPSDERVPIPTFTTLCDMAVPGKTPQSLLNEERASTEHCWELGEKKPDWASTWHMEGESLVYKITETHGSQYKRAEIVSPPIDMRKNKKGYLCFTICQWIDSLTVEIATDDSVRNPTSYTHIATIRQIGNPSQYAIDLKKSRNHIVRLRFTAHQTGAGLVESKIGDIFVSAGKPRKTKNGKPVFINTQNSK